MNKKRVLNILITQNGKHSRFEFEIPDSDEVELKQLFKWGDIMDLEADKIYVWECTSFGFSSKDVKP